MILIAGESDFLVSSLSGKFGAMHLGPVVELGDDKSLMDRLASNKPDADALFYFAKRQMQSDESSQNLDFLQSLWSLSAKERVPLTVVFYKYNLDFSFNTLAGKFNAWCGKQFRKPPAYYICLTGEVYGASENGSRIWKYYGEMVEKASVTVRRYSGMDGACWERETDFLYEKDLVRVLYWLYVHHPANGWYEIGSGFPRTDTAVAKTLFRAIGLPDVIKYDDFLHDSSSYAVQIADIDLSNLRRCGYKKPFYSLERGIKTCLYKRLKCQ